MSKLELAIGKGNATKEVLVFIVFFFFFSFPFFSSLPKSFR